MTRFLTRAACHFLGHEDELVTIGSGPFSVSETSCRHCGELAPDWAQPPDDPSYLQALNRKMVTMFSTFVELVDEGMRAINEAMKGATEAIERSLLVIRESDLGADEGSSPRYYK